MPPLRHHRGSLQAISARYQVKTEPVFDHRSFWGFSFHQSHFPLFTV